MPIWHALMHLFLWLYILDGAVESLLGLRDYTWSNFNVDTKNPVIRMELSCDPFFDGRKSMGFPGIITPTYKLVCQSFVWLVLGFGATTRFRSAHLSWSVRKLEEFYGSNVLKSRSNTLQFQFYSQLMIGVSNHFLSI